MARFLRMNGQSPYRHLVGVGGVGSGIFFELEGDATVGRNESRLGRLLDVRDYCKLHIVIHYIAKLLGAGSTETSFRITPIAKVGDDVAGQRVVREMGEVGIDTRRIQQVAGSPTLFSVCFQYPDGSGGNITTSNSAAGLLCRGDIDEASALLTAGGRQVIALAVPEVPLQVRRYFLELATRSEAFRAASFAGAEVRAARESGIFGLLDLVSLNQSEGEELAACAFSAEAPERFVHACQEWLRARYPKLKVIISVGKLGAYGITGYEYELCSPPQVNVASTAGAGDALLGGVMAAMAAGIPFLGSTASCDHKTSCRVDSALELGVLLGSYKCLSPHTIHPNTSLDALIEFAGDSGWRFSAEVQKRFAGETVAQPTR